MEKKTLIVIAVVAVVAIAAVAVFMMAGGNNSPVNPDQSDAEKNKAAFTEKWTNTNYKDGDVTWPARLLILGNADLDDDLDNDDVKVIQNLISKGYNYADDFMADANNDGLINSKDIDYLKKLMDYDNYKGIAYYFNCDFKIAAYDMSKPVKTSNILTQTLEMLCVLVPESVIAVDDRCANSQIPGANPQGDYWKEYASVLDYSKLGSVGSHKAPSVEKYLAVAKNYGGGYLTAVMNSSDTYNTSFMEEGLEGTNVQIIRCPSWERGGVDNGMLLLGFLFHKFDRATDWVEWHDSYYNSIMEKVSKLTQSQKKKVVVGVLGDTDVEVAKQIELNYTTSAEWQGLKRMGVIDVGGDYLAKHGGAGSYGAWSVVISKESFVNLCLEVGGIDYFIGTVPGPYNVAPVAASKPTTQQYMNTMTAFLDEYCGGAPLQVVGWEYSSGPNDLLYYATLANVLYGWGYDIEKIVNEGLQWMGVYGDGEYQWTFDKVKLSCLLPYDI